MWTIDARCSQCGKKNDCQDREKILKTLSVLSHELNTEEAFVSGPGDGLLVVACRDFSV
jgi:hypothetical protein